MILESVMSLVRVLLDTVFAFLPNVPDFDITLLDSLTTYINMIFDNLGLLGFFVRVSTIKVLTPLVIIVVMFEDIYHFILWVLKKIPFLNIE